MMNKRETNRQGLTWSEWWRAAQLTPRQVGAAPFKFLNAWRAGEDPSEYAPSSVGGAP